MNGYSISPSYQYACYEKKYQLQEKTVNLFMILQINLI